MKKIDQDKESRIQKLIDLSLQYKVNPYQMSVRSNNKISQPTFKNFLERKVNPNDSTLDVIEHVISNYIEEKEAKTENILVVEGDAAKILERKLDLILDKIEKMELKQDIMYEIIKNGVISSAEVVIKNQALSSNS